jgi:hypothetical protein
MSIPNNQLVPTSTHKVPPVPSASDHSVQFFDGLDTLVAAVATFVHDGLAAGANSLVVARPATAQAIAKALGERGVSFHAVAESGRVTILDANATLQLFMDGNVPDATRFHSVVGSILPHLREGGRGVLRVYGEMVDILANEGNFRGAEEIETLWNELAATESFMLFCGYLAAHFAGANGAGALRAICDKHRHVHRDHADLLATWLLSRAAVE